MPLRGQAASNNGICFVKSCYERLLEEDNTKSNELPQKLIGKVRVPTKVACFGWIATHSVCLTKYNLPTRE